jgi:hypothetical protein
MGAAVIRVQVHGREVEVACYGSGSDWVCRLTDPSAQPDSVNDAFWPAPDLGFLWFREVDFAWVVSGLVNRQVFRDADTVEELLDRVSREAIKRDEQMAECIEFVAAEFTVTFDGERGPQQGPDGWAEGRWWQPAGPA